jgi:Glycosyl transferase family 2
MSLVAPVRDITLVIPSYKGEELIGKTLASIASGNELPTKVIVVDDGSDDATEVRVAQWAELLPIHYVGLPENVGVAEARNRGLHLVDTRYVGFLDGDDIVLPDHVRLIVDALEQSQGLVNPSAMYWRPDGSLKPYSRPFRRERMSESNHLEELFHRNYMFSAAAAPTEVAQRLQGFRGFAEGGSGIPEPGTRGLCEDWDMWLRIAAEGAPIVGVGPTTVLYRLRDQSINAHETAMTGAGIHMLQVLAEEYPAHRAVALKAAERFETRYAVSALQTSAGASGRRVTPAEFVQNFSLRDTRSMVRLVALGALPPQLEKKLFGRRGL